MKQYKLWTVLALMCGALGGIIYLSNFKEEEFKQPFKVQKSIVVEQKTPEKTLFEIACEDESKREECIDAVAAKANVPDFVGTMYVDKETLAYFVKHNQEMLDFNPKINIKTHAITAPEAETVEDYFERKLNPKILFFDHVFASSSVKNEYDLISVMEHELDHALFYYEGDSDIEKEKLKDVLRYDQSQDPDLRKSIYRQFLELRSCDKQLKTFTDNHSQKYKNHIINYYFENYVKLWAKENNPTLIYFKDKEVKIADYLKLRFFRRWMLETYFGVDDRGFYLEPSEDFKPVTKRLYLPKEFNPQDHAKPRRK